MIYVLPEDFADQNAKDECYVTEASDREFWENVITAEGGVTTVRYAVHTLQLSVHDFLKLISPPKDPQAEYQRVVQAQQTSS